MSITEEQYAEISKRMQANGRIIAPAATEAPRIPVTVVVHPPRAIRTEKKRGANKWEQLYAEKLADQQRVGSILWFQFEGMRFRLADGAYYKPDYVAMLNTGELLVYEVKGMWREAARVRIKVAADRFPFRFIAVSRKLVREGGGWEEETFSAMVDRIVTGQC